MIPRLLDLFCGAGGASMDYHRAGFEVVGVDNRPQKRYPFEFHLADAITFPLEGFDAIHASPPCQGWTLAAIQWRKKGKEYPLLIDQIRKRLRATGRPYIIENVAGAPLINPFMLNGSFFGIKVNRKRYFECNFNIPFFLLPKDPPSKFKMGRPVMDGDMITPIGHFSNVPYARKEMGCDWMTGQEMTQAIPPIYVEWIGKQLMEHLSLLFAGKLYDDNPRTEITVSY